jgi:hypothetical protein
MNWGKFKTKGAPKERDKHVAFRASRWASLMRHAARARGVALMHRWLPPKPGLDAAAFVERITPRHRSKSLPPNAESLTGHRRKVHD